MSETENSDMERWERRENSLGITDKLCPECDLWSPEGSPCPICGNVECHIDTDTDRVGGERR